MYSSTWLLIAFAFIALNLYEPPSEASPDPLPPSLKTLPPELKEMIARLVDPIGLFSLRFIDKPFRRIIQPQKQQYIEHLLALECRVKYGGPPLPFRSLFGRPVWRGSAFLATRSRWACAGCVQLLPYYHFQNKFLAWVIWRKPRPKCPAAKIITSWEPVRAMMATPTPLPADGGRSIQNLFGFLEERFWGLVLNQEVLNRARGTSRHHRKCNECLFRDGFFDLATIARNHGMFGTERFPIISIEYHLIRSPVDRYFPGILDTMQQGRPVLSFLQVIPTPWTLWMARCPRCAKWQELRAFRFGMEIRGDRA
ncbi:uncharacterized protein FTJAE_1702 [Fusarium tjaetaba]|uniref:F-box domain-containing protein n=1 Tax=Fusarium tjaetaba TaxID=1567544 RepID=A0A8H5SBR4_9HYPO|nr:uncharacterized protein FTJAE_1702 [Fusarium tjaetaba]KAF5647646.1 hypothetical protein FTJAE_1702 [Fusarium tjaetaba]